MNIFRLVAVGGVLLCLLSQAQGQSNPYFNFTYPGPNPLALGPDCTTPLEPQLGVPIVTSKVGANITVSQFDSLASGFGLYTTSWTGDEIALLHWHVEDDQGNMADFVFSIYFRDLTPPVFDVSGAPTPLIINSLAQLPPPFMLPFQDNCTPNALVDTGFVQTTPPPFCSGGTFTRTWTATDTSGNTSVYTQYIQVYADTLAPTILQPPQNGSAPCAQLAIAYPAWLNAQMSAFQALDPSTPITYTNNAPPVFPSGCAVPLTVTFKATDACGHKTTQTAVFSTSDNAPPLVDRAPQDSLAYCSPGGAQIAALSDWIHREAGMAYHDLCSTVAEQVVEMEVNGNPKDSAQVIAAFLASYSNGCDTMQIGSTTYDRVRGKVTVDFFVKDPCGNSVYAGKATFGARDTLPPVLTGTNLVYEQCGGGDDQQQLVNWINNHGNALVSDDCSGTTWSGFSWLTSTGQTGSGAFGVGPYPQVQANNCIWYVDVTFKATDDCGNMGNTKFRFRIKDELAPVLSGFQALDTLYCPQAFPTVFSGTVSDNCDNTPTLAHAYHFSDTTCVGNYRLTVSWSATDDCGNTGTAVQVFQVLDTLRPVFTLVPPTIQASCTNYLSLPLPVPGVDVKATDPCGSLQQISMSTTSTQNPNPALCGHYTFTITRIFTAADACGNTSTATQLVQVMDNTGPWISGFADTTVVCDVMPVLPAPTATDDCSGVALAPSVQDTVITSGPCPDSYTITLVWQSTDVCGNTSGFSQDIFVQDTVRPTLSGVPADLFVPCDNIPSAPPLSSVTGTDNCDESVSVVFQESEIRDPNPANCAHWANYVIKREWTATDNCGNARTYTQLLNVQDNTGPEIVMPADVVLPSDPGQCGIDIIPPGPLSVFDDCTAQASAIVLRDTVLLLTAGGGLSISEPIGTQVFSWPSPNVPPLVPVRDTAVLEISLRNADGEGPLEYLLVYGEDGYLIGRTKKTAIACGNSDTIFKIAPALLNNWLTDGTLDISLVGFGSGDAVLNPYCPAGGKAYATLTYSVAQQQTPLIVTFNIDGDPAHVYPTAASSFLEVGNHVITYTATDCAGNSTTASVSVQVDDVEPPYLSSTPPPTAYVDADLCSSDVLLPFPGIVENCALSGFYSNASSVVPVKFQTDGNAGIIPKDITLTISGGVPNAVSGGTLRIRHRGDNAQPGEFFTIYDEDGLSPGGTTPGNPAIECTNFYETIIQIPANKLNNWAADGLIVFKLKANNDVIGYTDFINNCNPLFPDSTDGISAVQAVLEYDYAVVNYTVQKVSSGPILYSGVLFGNQTLVNLPPGNYNVSYQTQDAAGITGSTEYPIAVRDTVRPQAYCKNKTIFVNASGELPYMLTAPEINNGSYDNCSGVNLTFNISPATFTCNMAGTVTPVTLTVRDSSGNLSTCQSLVRVEIAPFFPSYDQICVGDTLFLYANPPATPGGPGIFTYMWTFPDQTSSIFPNPVIPNTDAQDEGQYTVKITGLTGCIATGLLTTDFIELPSIPILNAQGVCVGNDIVLTTAAFNGNGVSYHWYSGAPGNATLLAVTILPTYTVVQPAAGSYSFFVQVGGNTCMSQPSAVVTVEVSPLPVAGIQQAPAFTLCECTPRILGTSVQGGGITYAWTGPNGFSSNQQFPPVKPCVALVDSGMYTLTVYKNGCASAPVSVHLTVIPKPATPQISAPTQLCAGDQVQMTVNNIPSAVQYVWFDPALLSDTTAINALVLGSVTPADSGPWKVKVQQGGCWSDLSNALTLDVQPYPDVAAEANTPLCQGDPLQLTATTNITNLPLTYSWTHSNGYVSFQQNPTPPPDSGYYHLTVSTPNGCASTDSVYVQLVTPPLITAVTNNAPLCTDGSVPVTLSAVIVSQYPIATYQWLGPNGFASASANPVIPSANLSANGTYLLTVWDSIGCRSLPKETTVDVHLIPATPILAQVGAVCEGGNASFQITNASSYQNGSYDFIWTLPDNSQIVSSQPVLDLTNVQFQNAGSYSVRVSSDTCTSIPSTAVTLVVNPVPPPPVITATPNPVCAGSLLHLEVPNIPGATYLWTTPPGQVPQTGFAFDIPAAAETHEGYYFCTYTLSGCASAEGEGIFVEVLPAPATPIITTPVQSVCLDQLTDTLSLKITQGSTTPNAQYTWYNALSEVVAGPSVATFFKTVDFTGITPGANTFYVVASLGGCHSGPSTPVTVQFDEIPDINAYAGPNRTVCDESPFFLDAELPAGVTGRWTQTGGPSTLINVLAAPDTRVSGQTAGNVYSYTWTLSNGACENFSADTVQITAVAFEQGQAVEIIDTCFADGVLLQAQQGQTTYGVWSQIEGQKLLGVVIQDSLNPNTLVSNLEPGYTYFFYWTLQDIGCGESVVEVTVRNIGSVAFAGYDQTVCSTDSCALLEAGALPLNETGEWTSAQTGRSITSPYNTSTTVCGLLPGDNLFFWTTNDGVCGPLSTDSVIVRFEITPTARHDTIYVPYGGKVTFNVLENDLLPDHFDVTVTDPPDQLGTFEELAEGLYQYQPPTGFAGVDYLLYNVCNLDCDENACANAQVTLIIQDQGDCRIPSVITPNDDGVNDIFYVPCIDCDCIPDNEVRIFNQWGDEVYHAQPYSNDWSGTYNGEPLPAGTYFYIVKFNADGGTRTGFLVIQR